VAADCGVWEWGVWGAVGTEVDDRFRVCVKLIWAGLVGKFKKAEIFDR
jgi:hypothetical protein